MGGREGEGGLLTGRGPTCKGGERGEWKSRGREFPPKST